MQKSCYSYPVEFVEDVFGESSVLADLLKKATGSDEPKVLIVADMNVVQRTEGLGTKIGRYVQAHGIRLAGSPVVMAGGEKIKADNLQSALQVVSAILSAKLGRNDVVLALGERLYTAKVYFQTPDLFAWTAVIVAVSVLFEKLFLALVDALAGKAVL